MHRVSDVPVILFNPYLTCNLCRGYLIDATTIVECLHSFCRSCILTYLKLNTTCPVCATLLHKTKPHCAIRPDRALQSIVYKLIPNLFEKEMLCRRKFYEDHPSCYTRSLSPEKRGDLTLNTYVLQEEDRLSVELRYWNQNEHKNNGCSSKTSSQTDSISPILPVIPPTFLLCPPELTVGHIEKLIRMKFNLKPSEHEKFPTNSLRKRHVNNSDDEMETTPLEVSAPNSQISSQSSCKISLPTQFIKSISLSSPMLNTSSSVCSSLA
ncbi:unnamed protein product [Schistosoma mattheei]|uniref:RING-type domain-containing protein n=1 Tax=Schistosoma mattheei TaxID=31246 RepID=A0AA85BVJ3_9TREM|nr:unnamed protein product [Schistosoma mattheei]